MTAATPDDKSAEQPQALAGLRVLDLTQYIAGPYCTKLAAGFGAEVIKIERPGGDPLRSAGPFAKAGQNPETSIPFLWLNTGKKSLSLNLKTAEGVAVFKELVAAADIVVENFAPRVMPSLGLDYETLRTINPQLVMASISNFGQTGPYRDYQADEIELYAMGGAMFMTGDPDKPPLGSGPAIAQYAAGLNAYTAILLALWQREQDGLGQAIDISIQDCMLDTIENGLTTYLQKGAIARRGPHTFAPWGLYACRDGYMAVICAPFRHWTRGAEIFEEPKLMTEELKRLGGRVKHRAEVNALVQPWLSTHTRREICERAFSKQLAFGSLESFDEVLASPQHQARGFFDEIDHPAVGKQRYCGAPYQMSETPWKSLRAPLLGEHTDELLQKQGYSADKLSSLRRAGVIA